MLVTDYAQKRLEAFLQQIDELKQSEFPYDHSEEALDAVGKVAKKHLGYLKRLSSASDPQTLLVACSESLSLLMNYLPILGFVLRSTNVRNAFEVYAPLLKLAQQLLGENAKLVVSSEWNYSPFTYVELPLLHGFVLIGLPAPESGNPLLVPLAGHELGHSLWAQDHLGKQLQQPLTDRVSHQIKQRWGQYQKLHPDLKITPEQLTTDYYAVQSWTRAVTWALWQSEESFCDFIALYLFGVSFAHGFAYLLSPSWSGERALGYPALRRRALDIEKASAKYKVVLQRGYSDLFADLPEPPLTDQDNFLLSVADSASAALADNMIDIAMDALTRRSAPRVDVLGIAEARKRFALAVPAQGCKSLATIFCAGWQAFHDADLWGNAPQIQVRDQTLKEIILKSLEVFEIEQRQREFCDDPQEQADRRSSRS